MRLLILIIAVMLAGIGMAMSGGAPLPHFSRKEDTPDVVDERDEQEIQTDVAYLDEEKKN